MSKKGRTFKKELHPRGLGGRFLETADKPKANIRRLTPKQQAVLARLTAGKDKSRQTFNIAQAPGQKLVLTKLNPEQRERLRVILAEKASKNQELEKAKKPETKTAVKKPKATTSKDSEPETNTEPTVKRKVKRLPTLRKPVKESSVIIDSESFEIWKNDKNAKPAVDFQVRTDKKFEYNIQKDGVTLTLNRHHNVMVLEGDVVKGVPSLHPRLASDKTQTLMDSLARVMSYVESSPGTSPPSPDWKPTFHGAIDKKYLKTRKGAGLYGEMQIHHVDQWAKTTFSDITARRDKGEITTQEAQEEMRKLLRPVTKTNKAGKESTGYEIDIRPTQSRSLVILAAGSHDFNSPLFADNHPTGIHPDTGKLTQFGIPKEGEGGRKWFDKFRAKFWTEYYRREAFILRQELNKRMKNGDLTAEEAKLSWQTARAKVDKAYQSTLSLRKAEEEAND